MANTPTELQEEAVSSFVSASFYNGANQTLEWVREQAPPARDAGLDSISTRHLTNGHHKSAFNSANEIADPATKSAAMRTIARSWLAADPEAAAAALPSDLVEKYRQN